MNLAVWSGPRNLSTALMYAFAQRSDCAVWDEPFYAAYLAASGIRHPLDAEIVAAGETDPARVAAACASAHPSGKPVFYQKQMAHHILPGFPTDWIGAVRNVFLIRHPARVVASYEAKREHPSSEDLGFAQQDAIFERVRAMGQDPVVVDSHDIRADPVGTLERLCRAVGLGFQPAMLSWPAGGNPADGVWAPHWYGAVHRSTGFAGAEGALPELQGRAAELVEAALPLYRMLSARAI